MGAEHLLPPAEPVEALAAAAQLSEQHLLHIRQCRHCRVAWYHSGAFRAGCTDPRLGAQVLGALGMHALSPGVRAHLQHCLACRLLLLEARRAGAAPKPARHR
jgi:hypothetical protein